jgi:hypothetical protein
LFGIEGVDLGAAVTAQHNLVDQALILDSQTAGQTSSRDKY